MTQPIQATVNVKNLPISTKYTVEICDFIRNNPIDLAKKKLERILAKKIALPLKRFNKDRGHRKGNIAAGSYPVNSTKTVLKMLNSVESNASDKGMNKASLYIKSIIANHGPKVWRHGRLRRRTAKRTHLKIIVEERVKK